MIGRLQGTLLEKQPPFLLIDVAGVGYEVQAPMSTVYRLPEVGEQIVLHTHFVVREDAQALYGFFEVSERTLFRNLIKISGVGPKLALAILSGMSPDEFVACVMQNELTLLTRLPGVGKKTAERLLVEMRDKLKDWQPQTDVALNATVNTNDEAVTALIALGYKPQEASKMVSRIHQPDMSTEDVIKQALSASVAL